MDYPQELPSIKEDIEENRTKEWLAAHLWERFLETHTKNEDFIKYKIFFFTDNFDSEKAVKIYESHVCSMEGRGNGPVNPEQCEILKKITDAIQSYDSDPKSFQGFVGMLDAPGGTGKTFLIETLDAYCALPENNFLCLCSAFSGVAAQLLPNGVTIHRRFNMVPGMDPEQNCNIDRGSTKAKLLEEARLIVMDEVTMMSKIDLERIDRTLRYLMKKEDVPFGGKVIILSGDFRQILPVEKIHLILVIRV